MCDFKKKEQKTNCSWMEAGLIINMAPFDIVEFIFHFRLRKKKS